MNQNVSPYPLYEDLLAQTHLLVAGATGSGKSVVLNGIIAAAMHRSPSEVQFVLIDPKRVELVEYADLPHTVVYASEPLEMVFALRAALQMTESRFVEMQARRIRKYDGPDLYVIIDELADLLTTMKQQVAPTLRRLSQIGRAAKVHLVAATQCPLASVLDTSIKCNIDARIALRTRSRQDSRNIIEQSGCELLPRFGKAFYMRPEGFDLISVPMVPDAEREYLVAYWQIKKPRMNRPVLACCAEPSWRDRVF